MRVHESGQQRRVAKIDVWAPGGISALAPAPRILSPSTTIKPGETTRSLIPSNIARLQYDRAGLRVSAHRN